MAIKSAHQTENRASASGDIAIAIAIEARSGIVLSMLAVAIGILIGGLLVIFMERQLKCNKCGKSFFDHKCPL